MAPVPFRNIVSVSSEDDSNPASNLLEMGSGKKWLCSRENRSGRAEVVFMLSKRTRIASIEICNFGSAFVEVLVGNSDKPGEFVTLLPSSMMMSPADSKAGRSKTKNKTFPKERLSATAVSKKWNIVKIKCVQMYNPEAQFGLQYIAIYTESYDPRTPSAPVSSSTNHLLTPPHTPITPHTKHSYHQNPSLSTPKLTPKTEKTPKRTSKLNKGRKSDKNDDFEFSGLEKQSRLFRNCVRGKSSKEQQTNPILERVRNKFQKESTTSSSENGPLYERKKLLKTELPKAESAVDFMSGYNSKKQDFNVTTAFGRMASHDNDYEIGEEPEVKWGWNRFRGKPGGKRQKRGSSSNQGINGSPGEWLGKKRKKLNIMISECHAILDKASDPTSSSDGQRHGQEANISSDHKDEGIDDGCCIASDSVNDFGVDSDIMTHEYGDTNINNARIGGGDDEMIECPLCSELFPSYVIDIHASTCGEDPVISRTPIMPIVID